MITTTNGNRTGLLLSGGLDSAILLGHLLEQNQLVQPFFITSGLVWEAEELRAVRWLLARYRCARLEPLVRLDLPLGDVYGSHWSITGSSPPAAGTPDQAVYLPGRNALLLIKAALWCQMHGIGQLALGALASNPFDDASAEFFTAFEAVLRRGNVADVRVLRPFAHLSKAEVMQMGRSYPLAGTFSCLSPQQGLHCGGCNKCAERQAAFQTIDLADPTRYATDREQLPESSARRNQKIEIRSSKYETNSNSRILHDQQQSSPGGSNLQGDAG